MSAFLWSLVGLYAIIVVPWIAATFWVRRFQVREEMRIEPRPDDPPVADSPSLRVYVAAHNEENRIGACLTRLLAQNYGNFRITVVNDRSEDRTSERVREIMQRDSRVELVEVSELPAGWVGKTHALATATKETRSEYLLFVDCDCRLAAGGIAAVMQKVQTEGLEFVTLWPRLRLVSPAERLLTPAVSWLLGLWTLLGSREAADASQTVLGNGQFMLFSRSAYERIGGHGEVSAELAEDIMMARRVEKLGLKRWAGWGKGIYLSTRENDFSAAVNASTRVVIGSLAKPWRVLVSTFLVSGGLAAPVNVGLPALGLAVWTGSVPILCVCALVVVQVLAMHFVTRRLFSMTLETVPSVWSLILGGQILAFLLWRVYWIITGRGQVRWGNTTYTVRGSRIVAAPADPAPPVAVR
ncbi:MAG: glycosyltransferase [Phycisphaerae bacterium]